MLASAPRRCSITKRDKAQPAESTKLLEDLSERLKRAHLDVLSPDDRAFVEGLIERLKVALEELVVENTSLEQTRRLLEAEQARYQQLFELAPDAYLVTDEAGKILEANSSATGLFGVAPRLLQNKALVSFVDPPSRKHFRHLLTDLKLRPGIRGFEFPLRPRGRLPIPIVAKVVSVQDEVDAVGGPLRWILHDLTEQKQAEREVHALNRELEERVRERTGELEAANLQLDLVLQQIPAAVMVVDASGGIILTNRTMDEFFTALGGPRPERYTDLKLLGSDGAPCPYAERPLTHALLSGRETFGEGFLLALADGGLRSVEMSAAPLRERDGTISGAVLTTIDVTERAQRERADREFLANAAHQLRNPLAAIRGAIEVLQSGAKDDPGPRDRFLAHIERESERLTRLARALLVLARAQSNREELRKEIVNLDEILRGVVGRISPPPGVALELRCPPELAGLSNAELLEESLTCLADNAVRYAQRRVLLEGRGENGAMTVEISDDGPGIPLEEQDRVFERFYRAGDAGGSGLGLAIAAQAAEAMGATLEIDSRPGEGTAARIVLPAVGDH